MVSKLRHPAPEDPLGRSRAQRKGRSRLPSSSGSSQRPAAHTGSLSRSLSPSPLSCQRGYLALARDSRVGTGHRGAAEAGPAGPTWEQPEPWGAAGLSAAPPRSSGSSPTPLDSSTVPHAHAWQEPCEQPQLSGRPGLAPAHHALSHHPVTEALLTAASHLGERESR